MTVRPGIAPSRGRRALDIAVASAGLLMLAPVFVAVALAVRLSSRGPVLFRQVRIGQGGEPFDLVKFRSMRVHAGGPQVTVRTDVRVTRVGAVLRRTSLDELPQLLNVLRGDMTLVGPRPETPALFERYPEQCRWIVQHRPGLTGPTQLLLRDAAVIPDLACDAEAFYLEELVPRRVAIDAGYLVRPTLVATVRWCLRTAGYVTGAWTPESPSGLAAVDRGVEALVDQ